MPKPVKKAGKCYGLSKGSFTMPSMKRPGLVINSLLQYFFKYPFGKEPNKLTCCAHLLVFFLYFGI